MLIERAGGAGRGGIGQRTAATSFGVLFAAEWGDASQPAVAALAARYGDPVSVGVGAWLALVTVSAVAVLVGRKVADRIPGQLVQRAAGRVFVVLRWSPSWNSSGADPPDLSAALRSAAMDA